LSRAAFHAPERQPSPSERSRRRQDDYGTELPGAARLCRSELAADVATEAEQALFLTGQIRELDKRIANLYAEADPDPDGIVASAPGVGPVLSGVIAGRIGDPHRFTSLAAIRAYSGLIPKTAQSGTNDPDLGVTKAGDALLREAMFMAADHARKVDPQLAAKYQRLMSGESAP
jgi:transposase